MGREHDRQVFELLREALDWPTESRRSRLESACMGTSVSPDEVWSMLDVGIAADGVDPLDEPPVLASSAEGTVPEVGEQVGPYRLLEVLGEGGMGRVYLAEQTEPVQRKVALKLVRGRLFSPNGVERFLGEQRALARLAHPHIAQFYDAGTTADGSPYFVMEWVDGVPITSYCDANRLSVDDRLAIFLDVCAAVQHAHQKQILHRDLKPSNVLVAEHDGRAVATVIDFGIAKDLGVREGGADPATRSAIMGTPAYLAPEALRGEADTRSDVYSLGVLVYQLLTGKRPFRTTSSSLGDLISQIERGDATSPSSAVRGDDLEQIASQRAAFPKELTRRLRGDLDAIVAKSMERNPDIRYDSPTSLAEDIERHLGHEVISARPITWRVRGQKVFRRHRGAVLAIAAVAVALLLGTIGTTLGMLRARGEANEAQRSLAESESLASFLQNIFYAADPEQARGKEPTARELLDRGAAQVRTEFAEQPLVRARILDTLGDIYGNLGDYEAARPLLEEANQILQAEYGHDDPAVGAALHARAVLATKAGRLDEARRLYERTLQIQEATLDPSDPAIARTVYHLGVLGYRALELESARRYFERAAGILVDHPAERELYANVTEGLGAIHTSIGEFELGEARYRQALEIRIEELGEDHPHVAASWDSLCRLYTSSGRVAEAGDACTRALEIRERILPPDHVDLAMSLDSLAAAHRASGRYLDAEEASLRALAIGEEALEPGHFWISRWSINLAGTYWLMGRIGDAGTYFARAVDIRERQLGRDARALATPLVGLGRVRRKEGRLEEAEELFDRAGDSAGDREPLDRHNAAWRSFGLAELAADRDQVDQARELYEQAAEYFRERYRADDPWLREFEAGYRELLSR